jgi:hypothetical protein
MEAALVKSVWKKTIFAISMIGISTAVFLFEDSLKYKTDPLPFGSKAQNTVFFDRFRSSERYNAIVIGSAQPRCLVRNMQGNAVHEFPQGDCYFFENGGAFFIDAQKRGVYHGLRGERLWDVKGLISFATNAAQSHFYFLVSSNKHLEILKVSDKGMQLDRWPLAKADSFNHLTVVPKNSGMFPEGHLILSSSKTGLVVVWDPQTRTEVWRHQLVDPQQATLSLREMNSPSLLFVDGHGDIVYGVYIFKFRLGVSPIQFPAVEILNPMTKKIKWHYHPSPLNTHFTTDDIYVSSLPQDHILITMRELGMAYEVTREGRVVWEWYNPEKNIYGVSLPILRMQPVSKKLMDKIIKTWGKNNV